MMSSIIDYRDRTTCILFGDGAGAAVLSPAADDEPAIIDFAHEIDGSGGPALCMPAGGSRMPASHETVDERLHYVKQDGQTVFKFAVRKTEEISRRVLERNGLQPSDVDLFVSHQANRRIIKAAAERLGLPDEKVVINLERFGNTTGATIPLALADAVAEKAEAGRSGAARLGRRRLHRGRRAAPLGFLIPERSRIGLLPCGRPVRRKSRSRSPAASIWISSTRSCASSRIASLTTTTAWCSGHSSRIRAASSALAVMMSGRIIGTIRSASSTDDAGTTANFSLTSTAPATSPTAA